MAFRTSSTFATAVVPRRGKANLGVLAERRAAPNARPGQHLIQAIVICVAVATFCDGCSQTQAEQSTVPPATADSTTPIDDSGEIELMYQKFWDAGNTAIKQDPTLWREKLAVFATDPQLSRMLVNLKTLKSRSLTVYGATREHVSKIDIAGDSATVQDCQDASGSGQADGRTGEHRTVGIPRNPVTARLQRGADGKWKVAEISYPGGTC